VYTGQPVGLFRDPAPEISTRRNARRTTIPFCLNVSIAPHPVPALLFQRFPILSRTEIIRIRIYAPFLFFTQAAALFLTIRPSTIAPDTVRRFELEPNTHYAHMAPLDESFQINGCWPLANTSVLRRMTSTANAGCGRACVVLIGRRVIIIILPKENETDRRESSSRVVWSRVAIVSSAGRHDFYPSRPKRRPCVRVRVFVPRLCRRFVTITIPGNVVGESLPNTRVANFPSLEPFFVFKIRESGFTNRRDPCK